MRNLIKLFTLFIIAALLVSCEAEKIATHSGTSLLDSKKISLQQFLQETKINNFDTLIHLENKLQNRTADGRYELTDFEIDTDLINRMEYNQKTTYSFVASPKDTIAENYFNLIYYKKNNVWEMKIIELKPNPDNLIQLQNGLTTEFEGQMRMVYETVPTIMSQPCTYVTIPIERCQGCNQPPCDRCNICMTSMTYIFCNSNIQYISSTPSAPSSFNGGDGGGGGANADPNEIVIDPNLANLDFNKIILFLDNLRTTDLAAFNYLNSHPEIKNQVFRYLGQNDSSEESKIFVTQFIDQCDLNPTLHLDFKASSKSPYFVDLSLVSGNTPEELKFQEVYGDLMTSSNFRHFFSNLFNQSPFINSKFKIGDIPQTGVGYTEGTCRLSYLPNQISSLCTITIDRTILQTKSKAEIALVILHECLHAYLNVKFRIPSIGMSLDQINNMNFQQCINQYYNSFSGNQTQHNFMVDFLIPNMVQILKDIQDLIISPAQKNELENPRDGGSFLYQPLTNNPPTTQISTTILPWNWNSFYIYFCYLGLQNCSAYPFNVAPNFLNVDDFYNYEYIFVFNSVMQLH